MFERLNDEGRTIIMVTHEDDVAAHAKRIVRLRDGVIQSDKINDSRIITSHQKTQVPGVALPIAEVRSAAPAIAEVA